MHKGSLALLLHAHLPWVRHPEHEDFFEEDWLYEAITETYIPLLKILRRLALEKAPLKLTFTMTPTLCAMLRDGLLQERAERYLRRGVELARFYHTSLTGALEFYTKEISRDVVGAFAQLQEDGIIEIITCAATHGFLPLMESFPEAMRAQIFIGRDYYRECFGRDPAGIWLPECGYVPGIDRILQEANLRWFVVDAHGLMYGEPRPRFAIYSPYFTPAGPAVYRVMEASCEGKSGTPEAVIGGGTHGSTVLVSGLWRMMARHEPRGIHSGLPSGADGRHDSPHHDGWLESGLARMVARRSGHMRARGSVVGGLEQ